MLTLSLTIAVCSIAVVCVVSYMVRNIFRYSGELEDEVDALKNQVEAYQEFFVDGPHV